MPYFEYTVEYAHGSASGQVEARDKKEAEQKAKDMYHGLTRDTGKVDKAGNPIVEATKVTNVKVLEVKEGIK